MKKNLLLALSLGFLLVSCGTSFRSGIARIHQGSTIEQVQRYLGEPTLRRFDNNSEEWEYRRQVNSIEEEVFILTIAEGRVMRMNSYRQNISVRKQATQAVEKILDIIPILR